MPCKTKRPAPMKGTERLIFLRGTTRIGPPQRYGKPAFPAVTYRGHASGYCGSPASLPRRSCAVRTSSRSSGCGALNLWLPLSSPRRADREGSRILTPRDCYSILAPALCQGGRAPFDRMDLPANAILSVPGAWLYPPPPHCQGGAVAPLIALSVQSMQTSSSRGRALRIPAFTSQALSPF